jgi:predicted AlkP superfamily phosphohydrolase/phosphomutase
MKVNIGMSKNNTPKIFVLALDGATFDLIRPWVEEGHLPLFKQLMENGAWGELMSTIPPITPVAWLTFMTGKNPGRHGVFDFFRPIQKDYSELIPVSASLNQEPPIWRLLSQRGYRVCVLNVPMTYPPEPINGVIYAGVPTPANKADYSYPPELHRDLSSLGWDLSRDATFTQGSFAEYFAYLKDLAATRTDAALHLLQRETWDFFMIHYLETDQVLHSYWRFLESESPDHPLHDAMLHFYQYIEAQMARLLEHIGPNTQLLILSDHGMGPVHYHINLNNWLIKEGFLRWKPRFSTYVRRGLYKLGFTPSNIYGKVPPSLVKRLTLGRLRSELAQIRRTGDVEQHRWSLRRFLVRLMRLPFLDFDDIDWSNSEAYSTGTTQAGFIHVNLAGREPQGKVRPGSDYERVRTALREHLREWINPETGRKMVKQVYFKEDLYTGPKLEHAPDVVAIYTEDDYDAKKGSIFLTLDPVQPIRNANATHRPMGIFIAKGSAFRSGHIQESQIHLLDMAPLILYLLDEEIPEDFEGQLPAAFLDQSLLSTRSPRKGQATVKYSENSPDEHVDSDLSEDDMASVIEQLRGLGYIE